MVFQNQGKVLIVSVNPYDNMTVKKLKDQPNEKLNMFQLTEGERMFGSVNPMIMTAYSPTSL